MSNLYIQRIVSSNLDKVISRKKLKLINEGNNIYSATFDEPTCGIVIVGNCIYFTYIYASNAMWGVTKRQNIVKNIYNNIITSINIELMSGRTAKIKIMSTKNIPEIYLLVIDAQG